MGGINDKENLFGVSVRPLKQIRDERGSVLHVLRSDQEWFPSQVGEIYCSTVKQGAVKAWKRHLKMKQHFAVPMGHIRFVLYDPRSDSPTLGQVQVIEAGSEQYQLIIIPPCLWYGFTGLASTDSLIVNCATLPHDPEEVERLEQNSPLIPYQF